MGDVVNIKIDIRELDRIAQGLNRNTDYVIGTLAHQLEAYAKVLAPWDTRALINSIKAIKPMYLGIANVWHVTDGVEYGIYQELGFHHWLSGQFIQNPFMIPAAEKVAKDLNSGKTWERIFK